MNGETLRLRGVVPPHLEVPTRIEYPDSKPFFSPDPKKLTRRTTRARLGSHTRSSERTGVIATLEGLTRIGLVTSIILAGVFEEYIGYKRWAQPALSHQIDRFGDWAHGSTDDQEILVNIFKSGDETQFVHNLTVRVTDAKSVNLRDKPFTEGWGGDEGAGAIVDHLKDGTKISRAIPVLGNDPDHPLDPKLRAVWFGILTEDGKAGFLTAKYTDDPLAYITQGVEPITLKR